MYSNDEVSKYALLHSQLKAQYRSCNHYFYFMFLLRQRW